MCNNKYEFKIYVFFFFRIVDNLLIWTFIRNSIDYLPKKYSTLYDDFKKVNKLKKLHFIFKLD